MAIFGLVLLCYIISYVLGYATYRLICYLDCREKYTLSDRIFGLKLSLTGPFLIATGIGVIIVILICKFCKLLDADILPLLKQRGFFGQWYLRHCCQ